MTRAAVAESERRAIAADFPKRDVEAIYARFLRWSERRQIHSPERAFRTWVENAERDDTQRIGVGRPATEEYTSAPLGERSDPSYAAFRFGLVQRILSEKLSPAAVADILAEYQPKFADLPHDGVDGGLGVLLDAEIAHYRLRGESW